MTEEHNPNAYKFFDPRFGMTYNRRCPCCKKDTWVQESVHTCYEGKRYLTNQIDPDGKSQVVGILHGIGVNKSEIWCEDCYIKEFESGKIPEVKDVLLESPKVSISDSLCCPICEADTRGCRCDD